MDAEAQAIFVARVNLARLQHPARPAFEAQQRRHIVVEAAARNMRRQFGAERFDRKPRDMFAKQEGVRPDVAAAGDVPGARALGAPFALSIAPRLAPAVVPALRMSGRNTW